MKKTAYEKIVAAGANKRGRKPLPEAEKAKRIAEQRAKNRMRAEARRRALVVLAHSHKDEFNALYKSEYEALSGKETKASSK
jgi:predicted metallo-beta-lactamase superfamily hydrolase